MQQMEYPVRFSVDYPDRPLDQLTTAFRIFAAIPIVIVLGTVTRPPTSTSRSTSTTPTRTSSAT